MCLEQKEITDYHAAAGHMHQYQVPYSDHRPMDVPLNEPAHEPVPELEWWSAEH